jgi:SAM-dependent methyltransferase
MAGDPRGPLRRVAARLFGPASPDAARRLVQEPLFRKAVPAGPPHGRCLNAGSGSGLYSGFLESFGTITEIVNVDMAPPTISERRADNRHRDLVGSVTELPFEAGSFDWILCTNVLPCLPDDRPAALELGRVLKPGGHALISVRTPAAPTPRADEIVRDDGYRVVRDYTLDELRTLLAEGGLEVVWHGYCCHLPMKWLLALWKSRYVRRGPGGRSLLPRFVVLAFGYADRLLPVGRPWDLTVLAAPAADVAPSPNAP